MRTSNPLCVAQASIFVGFGSLCEVFAYKVLEKLFEKIISEGTLSAGNDLVVSMAEIFELIAVEELKENQIKYGS